MGKKTTLPNVRRKKNPASEEIGGGEAQRGQYLTAFALKEHGKILEKSVNLQRRKRRMIENCEKPRS